MFNKLNIYALFATLINLVNSSSAGSYIISIIINNKVVAFKITILNLNKKLLKKDKDKALSKQAL